MKTNNLKLTAIALVLCAFAMLISSFDSFDNRPGGDSFTIYLNDKLVVEQYVHMKEKTKTISLTGAADNDVLRIHYSHCGKMGVARVLAVKDSQNKIVKIWKFQDSSDANAGAMKVTVGDINKISKTSGNKSLSLVYSSEQLRDGITLATLSSNDVRASLK